MKTTAFAAIALLAATPLFADDKPADPVEKVMPVTLTVPEKPTRPASLPALYVGLAGLQAYDGYSTLRGVRSGAATEANPIVAGIAGQPAAFWSLKAASTGLSIFLAEQYWRSGHRKKAVWTMVVANGLMAAVAARNMQVLRR